MTRNPTLNLPSELTDKVTSSLSNWKDRLPRIWNKDATVWTNTGEADWLGWLEIVKTQMAEESQLSHFASEIKDAGFRKVLLLGMGGSSLCPEVLEKTFGHAADYPELLVLDSTDPAQVASFAARIDPAETLFIVASKSGSTLEPNIFNQYFFDLASRALGEGKAGSHFVAITDPGSKMQSVAERDGFRRIFFGLPSIGGRYSALSNFGLVPAALIGVDLKRFLSATSEMVAACKQLDSNPGLELGVLLGEAANAGRNKLTIFASPAVSSLGAWLEQLIAESTGKDGKAIIPVDGEAPAAPEGYGSDRVFAYLRYKPAADPRQDAAVKALAEAGHPVVTFEVNDVYELGQQMFCWEIATAVAGAIMGINPFNQPDVEASKIETRKLTTEYEVHGSLPAESPFYAGEGVKLFSDPANVKALSIDSPSLAGILKAHLDRIAEGDYFAVLGYIEMNSEHNAELQAIRHAVRDRLKVATCLGFGPRFLHSTGQAYKGGPDSGVFLQITCDDANDLKVPGQAYTFGVVKSAQARGDFQVLADRGRRALRIHLGADVAAGLNQLKAAVVAALS